MDDTKTSFLENNFARPKAIKAMEKEIENLDAKARFESLGKIFTKEEKSEEKPTEKKAKRGRPRSTTALTHVEKECFIIDFEDLVEDFMKREPVVVRTPDDCVVAYALQMVQTGRFEYTFKEDTTLSEVNDFIKNKCGDTVFFRGISSIKDELFMEGLLKIIKCFRLRCAFILSESEMIYSLGVELHIDTLTTFSFTSEQVKFFLKHQYEIEARVGKDLLHKITFEKGEKEEAKLRNTLKMIDDVLKEGFDAVELMNYIKLKKEIENIEK